MEGKEKTKDAEWAFGARTPVPTRVVRRLSSLYSNALLRCFEFVSRVLRECFLRQEEKHRTREVKEKGDKGTRACEAAHCVSPVRGLFFESSLCWLDLSRPLVWLLVHVGLVSAQLLLLSLSRHALPSFVLPPHTLLGATLALRWLKGPLPGEAESGRGGRGGEPAKTQTRQDCHSLQGSGPPCPTGWCVAWVWTANTSSPNCSCGGVRALLQCQVKSRKL